ncbi:hypothetical protein AGMMS49965_17740 [Bacteroidia bacterium]|nr:hypothetical protein AGMMS49965_17720 [Bacteroidia bacterium]GHT43612.1 hypothetical protein AGMMS49965_17740 [Bacteroidia bacterium]
MKKTVLIRSLCYTALLLWGLSFFAACTDDYFDRGADSGGKPEWLGSSIYAWLENPTNEDGSKYGGTFSNYLRIINSIEDAGVGYREVLSKTGSKTLFVADDAAFDEFFRSNALGITRFEDFAPAQLRAILFSGMLDNTYLLEMLSSVPGSGSAPPVPGQAMRHPTSWNVLDTVPFEIGDALPHSYSGVTYSNWAPYRDRGIHILKDQSLYTLVFFLDDQMKAKGYEKDFRDIVGVDRQDGDAHVFNAKIIRQDVTCQNGYINVLDRLLLPVDNLEEHLRKNPDTQLFSSLLERFSVPGYSAALTATYRETHPNFTDSIFVKRFYTELTPLDPVTQRRADALLSYDPGMNAYSANGAPTAMDMAAMFVPTDEALKYYFNRGEGSFLKERYGNGYPDNDLSWLDNMPNTVLSVLLNNHLRSSFLGSTPGRFKDMEDKMGTSIGVDKSHIQYTTVCSNGVAYITDHVYPPSDYASVIAPVLVNANTQIFNKVIKNELFDLYLLAGLEAGSNIKFSLLVPTDAAFGHYINPMKPNDEWWRFYINGRTNAIEATAFGIEKNDSLRAVPSASVSRALFDILDNHVVVGEIESGKQFYQTKGGATIKVSGTGLGMTVQGGSNIEQNETPTVTSRYPQNNGVTYLLDKIVQPAAQRSVYQVMQTEPEFSKFFSLCSSAKPYKVTENGKEVTYGGDVFTSFSHLGLTFNVAFFNTFNYSIYIPTNAAINKAIADGVIEELPADPVAEDATIARKVQKLYNFLRYHFQDNSVYIGGTPLDGVPYETASLNQENGKFRTLEVKSDNTSLQLTDAKGGTARVITTGGKYNIMARDCQFNGVESNFTSIYTSSFAVIHQIDEVLTFE